MRRLVVLLTVVLFFIWLLPLGIFIKPSQEKVACDGRRAICMCSVYVTKKIAGIQGKVMITGVSQGANKEAPSSGGSGSYFLSGMPAMPAINLPGSPWESPAHFSSLLFIQSIEHVPKF